MFPHPGWQDGAICRALGLDLTYISKQTTEYVVAAKRPFSSSGAVRHFYAIFTGPYQPLLVLTSSSQVFVTQSSLSTFLLSTAILGISSELWASSLSFSPSLVTRKYKTVFLQGISKEIESYQIEHFQICHKFHKYFFPTGSMISKSSIW